jgi:hypothetical protein
VVQVRSELVGDEIATDADGDVDAGVTKPGDARARHLGIGVLDTDDHRATPAAMSASAHGGVRP